MADEEKDPREATTHADLYHRHGDPDPSKWDEAEAVTGRPNDTPLRSEDEWAVPNTTLADRAKARKPSDRKQVDSAENKAVSGEQTKAPAKKAAAKRR